MIKKGLAVFLMVLLAAPLFADVELSTSINDVFHEGTDELAGSITMRVNADDFNNASTTEPVFIRVTLDHQATLAETLVNLNSGSAPTNDEILLAMTANTTTSQFSLIADVTTVSIVRWVAGESSFWIRVQDASTGWLGLGDVIVDPVTVNGLPFAPSEAVTVSWTLGISARSSAEDMDNVDRRLRNLPYNTRNDALDRSTELDNNEQHAVSTLICVDLEDGNLQSISTSGVESLLNFDPIAFDEEAESSPGIYRPGNDTGINFTNDFSIARGKRRACTVEASAPKADAPVVALCVDDPGENLTVDGWVCDDNEIIFAIDCDRGGDFLDTDMYNGAFVRFSTAGDTYGFRRSTDGSSDTAVTTEFSGGFVDSDGDVTYRTMDVVWAAGFEAINTLTWSINVKVWRYYTDGAVDVALNWSLVLVNHDGAEDIDDGDSDGDFDGSDQHRRCNPSEFTVGTGTWAWGSFVECSGNPAVLFFPYLPMLRGNDLFWSGVSVVNHGDVPFDELDVIIYQEDGVRFDATLPGLAVHSQYTWLLVYDEDAATIGFNGMGDNDGTLITPAPYVVGDSPDLFGASRMSMFVVGNFDAEFTQEQNAGDLDGYLLVGSGSDIDGSYLPRNEDGTKHGLHSTGNLPNNMARKSVTDVPSVEFYKTRPATYKFINGRIQN